MTPRPRPPISSPGRLPALTLALALVTAPPAFADPSAGEPPDTDAAPRYEVYFDQHLSSESGAREVASAVTFVAAGEAWLDHLVRGGGADVDEADRDGAAGGGTAGGGAGGDRAGRRAAATALRALRTIVWDAPVAWWFGVVDHEGFGHGGRAREFDASPGLHLGSPWEGRVSFATFNGQGKSTEQLLYIYTGGTEANTLAATFLERRAVEGVRLRPLDLLFLASSRLVASRYVLRTTPDPRLHPDRFFSEYSGGGDVANYLGLLHELHGDGTGITPGGVDDEVTRQLRRLRRQAWWNALDPGAWWAIGSALRLAARGDDSPPLPLPRIGDLRYLPVFSSEWTPSGGETSLEWIAGAGGHDKGRRFPPWFSFVVRRGRGPSGSFGAAGAAADDLAGTERLSFGGAAEVWHDPRNGIGGGARLRLRLRAGYFRGFYVDLGAKSQGYWIGQPATAGPYAAVGLRYEP